MRKTRPAQMVLQLRRHRRRGGKLRCSGAVGSGRHERQHVRAELLEERSQPIGLVLQCRATCCNAGQRVATQSDALQRSTTCCNAGQHVATQHNMLRSGARSRSALSCAAGAAATFAGHRRLPVAKAPPSGPIDYGQRQPHDTQATQATTRSWCIARTALAGGLVRGQRLGRRTFGFGGALAVAVSTAGLVFFLMMLPPRCGSFGLRRCPGGSEA